ncbi:MAG TPA: ROK family protein [Jiangellales bacterium]|nr:ROK family protein [Jiangellales bacterium]
MAASAGRTTARTGFGVDVGGSGIKGAPVHLGDGSLAAERHRIETPPGARPDDVVDVIVQVVRSFDWEGPFGCTFPGIVRHGVIGSAANVDKSWIGVDLAARLTEATGRPAVVVNDADAAGLAESHWGAAKGRDGVVLVTTLGTGIGTALFVDGHLVPNTELGHLEIDGKDAESRAASSVRERKRLTWEQWAVRLQRYYEHLEFLFSPDLFVVGGGVSKKAEKFLPLLDLRTEIVPAGLLNEAGIAGAAALASDTLPAPTARRRRRTEVPA